MLYVHVSFCHFFCFNFILQMKMKTSNWLSRLVTTETVNHYRVIKLSREHRSSSPPDTPQINVLSTKYVKSRLLLMRSIHHHNWHQIEFFSWRALTCLTIVLIRRLAACRSSGCLLFSNLAKSCRIKYKEKVNGLLPKMKSHN